MVEAWVATNLVRHATRCMFSAHCRLSLFSARIRLEARKSSKHTANRPRESEYSIKGTKDQRIGFGGFTIPHVLEDGFKRVYSQLEARFLNLRSVCAVKLSGSIR